ncbi:uncharacterized protein [Dermacentor andersoni]|uniref:uncharacterized protein n=1 Tax=Dermacentor andersoni TaxID=34620 RepID=UPI0024170C6F|nr:uncharacterized protein LOC129383703 [Dermacentor andersoni]
MENSRSMTLSERSMAMDPFWAAPQMHSRPMMYGTGQPGTGPAPIALSASFEPRMSGADYQGPNLESAAGPASYGRSASGVAASSLSGTSTLTTGPTYIDSRRTSTAVAPSTKTNVGEKYSDETEREKPYGIWLPMFTCMLVLVVLIFLTTYLVSSGSDYGTPAAHAHRSRRTASTPVVEVNEGPPPSSYQLPPAGYEGGPCNASVPCLGHGHCKRGICRCIGPHLAVAEGVCMPTTTRRTTTKRPRISRTTANGRMPARTTSTQRPRRTATTSSHGSPTTTTLPPFAVFTHRRTVNVPMRAAKTTAGHPVERIAEELTNSSAIEEPATNDFMERSSDQATDWTTDGAV